MVKLYDTKSYELAKYFLDDVEGHFEAQIDELAKEIQTTVEDFIALNCPDPGRNQVDVQ